MAFQSVPETADILIQYTLNGEPALNAFAARKVGGYNLSDLQLLADAVDAAVAANWLQEQTLDARYDQTVVRGLEFENDQEAIQNAGSGIGLRLGTGLPGNVTISIKKSSGLTGRSARGRLYWMGMPKDQLSSNENVVLTANVVLIVAAVEAVRLAIDATVWFPVIVSRFTGGLPRNPGVTFPWLVTSVVNNNVDSNRRRLTT